MTLSFGRIQRSNCMTDLGFSLWAPALGKHPHLTLGDEAYMVSKIRLSSIVREEA